MRQSAPLLLVVLLATAPVVVAQGLFQAIGFLPSVFINTFFQNMLQPVTDELCFDFVKQFQLQERATCECTGGINSNLGFWGEGVCTLPDEVCVGGFICGEVKIYPKVVTERINFITVLTGDVADAIDNFDLSAKTVLGDDLVVLEIETVGSVAQCLVDVKAGKAEIFGQECTIGRLPFEATEATCKNNENIPKEFSLICPDRNSEISVDVTLQSVV